MDAQDIFARLSQYYHLSPADRVAGEAALADWNGGDYILLGKCWLLSPDGYVWRYASAGSLQNPRDRSAGIWSSNVVEMWTGGYMATAEGRKRKLIVMAPTPPQKHYARGWRHPIGVAGGQKNFNPDLVQRRAPAPMRLLATEGITAARVLAGKV